MNIRTKIINKLVSIQMSGWSKGSIEAQRARQERTAKYVRLGTDIQRQPINADGVPAEWIQGPGAGNGT